MQMKLQQFCIDVAERGTKRVIGTFSTTELFEAKGLPMAGINPQEHQILGERRKKYCNDCLTLLNLKHPNVVRIYGINFPHSSSLPMILIEEPKKDFYIYLQQGSEISLTVKISILMDTIRGLSYLHERKILHLDLNAKCVLLDAFLNAKVSNFQLARQLHQPQTYHRKNSMASPSPKCPDHLPLESQDSEIALDVFSLGHLMLCAYTQVNFNYSIKYIPYIVTTYGSS